MPDLLLVLLRSQRKWLARGRRSTAGLAFVACCAVPALAHLVLHALNGLLGI